MSVRTSSFRSPVFRKSAPRSLVRPDGRLNSRPDGGVNAGSQAARGRNARDSVLHRLVLVGCLLGLTVAVPVRGDEVPPAGSDRLSVEDLPPGPNLIYHDAETGKVWRMPGFTPQMLDDLLRRSQLQTPSQLFEFVELKLTGETRGEFVFLHAELRIDVLVDEERVVVPLGFDDLKLRDQQHTASRIGGWGKRQISEQSGKSWILYGQGEHLLTLDFVGEIRTATNGQQRIRLNVPVVATSSLKLLFDSPVESAQLLNGIPPILTPGEKPETTQLEAFGLAETADIAWTLRPTEEKQTVAIRGSSPATMRLDLNTDPGSLSITQNLNISGGSIDELAIRLPPRFVPVSIEVTDAEGNSIYNGRERQGTGWLVRFNSPMSGPVTLRYDLEFEKGEYSEQTNSEDVAVRVPQIDAASNLTGNLEIQVPNGVEVVFSETNTRRIRVESPSDSRTRVTAYRLLSPRSEVRLKISETEAFYSVLPHISFETAAQENTLELTARFKVNMVRGSRIELDMDWPRFLTEGWRISGDPRLTTEDGVVTITGYTPDESVDSYRLVFPERQSGQFEVELQAFRDLESVQQAGGITYLPDLPGSTSHSTVVSLIESDADSMVISRPGEAPAFPVLPSSRWPEELRRRATPPTVWLVDTPEEPVQIRITAQTPEVRVAVDAELAMAGDAVHVSQLVQYDVRHEDIAEVQLATAGMNATVRLKDTAESLIPVAEEGDVVTYSLPFARRGKFDILVDYFWPPSEDPVDPSGLPMPLVRPAHADQKLGVLTVATASPQAIQLRPDENWDRVFDDEFEAAWECRNWADRDTVNVKIVRSLETSIRSSPTFAIMDSSVWGTRLLTTITYVFEDPADSLLFSFDAIATVERASVNGRAVTISELSDDNTGRRIFQVPVDSTESGGMAVVELAVYQPFQRQHELFSLLHPELPQPVGMDDDSCTVLWVLAQRREQTIFEAGGHGLTNMGGASTSRFFWQDQISLPETLDALLLTWPEDVRTEVRNRLSRIENSLPAYDVLAGAPVTHRLQIIVVSRRLVYLAMAVLAVLAYVITLRVSGSPLVIVVSVSVIVSVFCWAIAPPAVQSMMLQMVPAVGLSSLAAALQRRIAASVRSPFRNLGETDGNTVFAVEQPAKTVAYEAPSTTTG